MALTIKQASKNIGGLSNTSKMPCPSYGLNTENCITGSKLKLIENTVCNICYVDHGFATVYPCVRIAQNKRLELYNADPQLWIESIAFILNKRNSEFFRWFDSGDLQSVKMLKDIVSICNNTPNCKHWLPTKETKFVSQYKKQYGNFPANLTIRLSAVYVDGKPPLTESNRLNVQVSEVTSKGNFTCLAPLQEHKCLDCRMCWDSNIKSIIYQKNVQGRT